MEKVDICLCLGTHSFNLDLACDKMAQLILGNLPGDEYGLAPNDRQAHALHNACRELDALARDIEGRTAV